MASLGDHRGVATGALFAAVDADRFHTMPVTGGRVHADFVDDIVRDVAVPTGLATGHRRHVSWHHTLDVPPTFFTNLVERSGHLIVRNTLVAFSTGDDAISASDKKVSRWRGKLYSFHTFEGQRPLHTTSKRMPAAREPGDFAALQPTEANGLSNDSSVQ